MPGAALLESSYTSAWGRVNRSETKRRQPRLNLDGQEARSESFPVATTRTLTVSHDQFLSADNIVATGHWDSDLRCHIRLQLHIPVQYY
jgi:hypothetical protein